MSSAGGMDIRAPLGGLFLLLGVMLAGYGLLSDARDPSGSNVNLWWGAVMIAFGVIMIVLSRRGTARAARAGAVKD